MWIPFISLPLTFGASVVKNARVYAIYTMSSRRKALKKGLKRFVQDPFLFAVLAIFVGVAVLLLAVWHNAGDKQGYYISDDLSSRIHVCTATTSANKGVIIVMIIYIGILMVSTGLLSYLTSSIYDSLSEASFLSSFFLLGISAFAVTLATNYNLKPSISSLMIRNVVIWVIANVSLLISYLPKLAEAILERKEQVDLGLGNLPSASLFSESETKYSEKLVTATGKSEQPHKSLSHINLRAAWITYKKAWWRWSKWSTCGVTLFNGEGKKWIVFEMQDRSLGCLGNKGATLQMNGPFVRAELESLNGSRFQCLLEFENSEKLDGFVQTFKSFLEEN
ncbi:hypothetical protein HDU76_005701 [Blyttiomyces sp. JEL0837]|nr:hypothetical protein HDU76_005701 [Blyttiomyces sp. JEL0837]